jgi:hypothetical protein
MGNRFREKAVEEGLEGDVAREALESAQLSVNNGTRKGNRKRVHMKEKVEEEKIIKSKENEDVEKINEEVESEDGQYEGDEVEVQPRTLPNSRGGRVAKGVAKVLGGDILADTLVLGQIKLLLLCVVFLLLIVANRYQVESLSRRKAVVMERVNELREQQIQLQKRNQNAVRISQIRDDLQNEKGLGIMPMPPEVI